MRIPSGKTDQKIFFVALDTTLASRVTGLSSWTVYRSRNGGTATAYTTPTVAELSAGNMPGVYALTVDEDTTIASTSDSEEYAVHITATGMAPVTRTIELYRQIWEASTANHTTAGTFGQKVNNIYAVVDTEVATLQTDVTAIKAKTDQLAFGTANRVNAQTYGMEADVITSSALATSAVTEINTGIATSASIAALPTAATIADAVWDESLAGHVSDSNSAGWHLNNVESLVNTMAISGVAIYSGSASALVDAVWDEPTTGHTTSGTFGEQAKTDIDAILAKTASLTFTVAGQVDSNLQAVNDVAVTGTGAPGDEWGP